MKRKNQTSKGDTQETTDEKMNEEEEVQEEEERTGIQRIKETKTKKRSNKHKGKK